MSEVTDLSARIARLQDQIAQNQAELATAQREFRDRLVARLEFTIAQQQQQLAQLQTQLAQAQQREALATTSSGQVVKDDAQATQDRPQTPNATAQVLTPDGRIVTQPDTPTGTTATPAVTDQNVDTGTNAPVRTISQTQATPAELPGPGLVQDPADADAQAGGFYGGGVAPATTQAGVGAGNDDVGQPKNFTRTEIDNIFNETKIVPRPNVLDQYASYTYSASLYLMTPESYQAMINQKKPTVKGDYLLIQSGGIPVSQRNEYFPNDYYIDKFTLKSVITGKGTNAAHNVNSIQITVVEPNGITLIGNLDRLIQSVLGTASKKTNYLSQLYLFVIRFYGYDEQGNLVRGGVQKPDGSSDPNAFVEKFYPIAITDIKFTVANKLVEYTLTCTSPSYLIAASQNRGSIPYNVELSAMTVKDALVGPAQFATQQVIATETGENYVDTTVTNSPPPAPPNAAAAPTNKTTIRQGLITALNNYQEDLVKRGTYTYADRYTIEFTSPAIEQASIKKPGGAKKSKPMAVNQTAAEQKLPEKQSMDNSGRIVTATAGMQVVAFLDQILRNSTYIEQQQTVVVREDPPRQEFNGNPANNVAWYKIGMEVKPIEYDPKRNDYAYDIKYIVSPYKINNLISDYFQVPTYKGVHKQYNYWFTGENISVLNYEQKYNALYTATLSGGPGQLGGSVVNDAIKANFYTRSGESSQGAEGRVNEPAANAADYLYNPGDLADATLTIVGDPAWLQQGEVFAGMYKDRFNYSAFMPDGTINFESQQILFEILINTPRDYDLSTGLIDPNNQSTVFQTGQQPGRAKQSYVYNATECTSEFNRGKFTQTLKGVLLTYLPDQSFKEQQRIQASTQQQVATSISTGRTSGTLNPASPLTNIAAAISTPAFSPVAQNLNLTRGIAASNNGLSLLGGLNANKVLGGQSTRPFPVPGLPTSLGLPVGLVNSVISAPNKLVAGDTNTISNQVNQVLSSSERNIRGVVDSVSTGSNQVIAGNDDSGTALVQSPVAETTYESPAGSTLISEAPVEEFNANNDFFA